jgi:hypothetical protein
MNVFRTVTTSMLLVIAFDMPLAAQQFSGTLRGTVQDSTGAIVQGAEVSVVDVATNDAHTMVTDETGSYVVPQLKPGFYRIIVKKPGFKTPTLDQIKVDVQQVRAVDVTLELGATSEAVNVVAVATTIETTSATISQTIENRRLVDLPLNGRNPFSLATLAPGVIPSSNNSGSSPFISGGRNATSEVTIDGVSNVNAENNAPSLEGWAAA